MGVAYSVTQAKLVVSLYFLCVAAIDRFALTIADYFAFGGIARSYWDGFNLGQRRGVPIIPN